MEAWAGFLRLYSSPPAIFILFPNRPTGLKYGSYWFFFVRTFFMTARVWLGISLFFLILCEGASGVFSSEKR
jgi:hypothetical protein